MQTLVYVLSVINIVIFVYATLYARKLAKIGRWETATLFCALGAFNLIPPIMVTIELLKEL